MFKVCTKCGEEKPATVEYFYRRSGRCIVCKNMYHKKWREENPEYHKKYYEKNYEKNREKDLARCKKYREKNREKIKARQRKWREENSEYKRKYMKQRRQEDPIFKLLCNMRNGLTNCLSGKSKNSHTMQYVDKTADELMNYLEERFTEGMTQTNYGQWHVDHIRPLSSFNFYQFEEGSKEFENLLHIAWNYTNLQPLWAVDNIKKGSQYEH